MLTTCNCLLTELIQKILVLKLPATQVIIEKVENILKSTSFHLNRARVFKYDTERSPVK